MLCLFQEKAQDPRKKTEAEMVWVEDVSLAETMRVRELNILSTIVLVFLFTSLQISSRHIEKGDVLRYTGGL